MDFEKTVPERYRATYDSKGDRWLILDLWNPQIKNMADLTQDIPENSPALKVIAGTEMNAVIGTMIKMGWFEKNIIKHNTNNNIIKEGSYTKKKKFFPYPKKYYNRSREEEIERIVNRILDRREFARREKKIERY